MMMEKGTLSSMHSVLSMVLILQCTIMYDMVQGNRRYIFETIDTTLKWKEIPLGNGHDTTLDLWYSITLPANQADIVLYFAGWDVDSIITRHCFPFETLAYRFVSNVLQSMVVLTSQSSAGCRHQGDTLTCSNYVNLKLNSPEKWRAYMGFSCFSQNPTGLNNVTYYFDYNLSNNTGKCLNLTNECATLYNYTSFPNALGMSSFDDAVIARKSLHLYGFDQIASECYQHVQTFFCLFLFPKCADGNQIQICRSACLDFLKNCGDTNQVKMLNFVCESFPESNDPKICSKSHVDCGIPSTPNNGSVFFNLTTLGSEATYDCPPKFTLSGNITRTCEFTGQWSGEMPRCIANTLIINEENPVSLIAGLSTTAALLVIMAVGIAVVLIVWQHEVQVIFYAKFGLHCCRTRTDQNIDTELDNRREHDLFLCYANEDRQIALQDLLNLLEGPEFNLKVHVADRDFLAGNPISDNIDMAIAGCSNMLILVSQATIDSDWCIYEFQQGYVRMIQDPSFQLILIVLSEPKEFYNVPGAMKAYFSTRTYIKYWDMMFADRLKIILHH